MRTTTNRIRLRIDLALAQLDEPPSAEGIPSRRQLLAPPAPARPSDRSRPILLAPGRDLTPRQLLGDARLLTLTSRPPASPPGPRRRDYADWAGVGRDPAEEVSPRHLRSHPDQAARTTAVTTTTASTVGTGPSSDLNRSFSPISSSEVVPSA